MECGTEQRGFFCIVEAETQTVQLDALWAYTRLPVVQVTQKQRALSWVVLKVLKLDFPRSNAENKIWKKRKSVGIQ